MRARNLKSSLPAICRAVTRQKGIELVFQGPPRTDGKTIYSNPLAIDADDDDVDIIVGDIDHECAHILYSDFEYHLQMLHKVPEALRPLTQGIWNALEDTVVERREGDDYLGCRETLARSVELVEQRQGTAEFAGLTPARILTGYVDSWGRMNVLGQGVKNTFEAARAALRDLITDKGLLRLDALLSTHLYSACKTQDAWRLAQAVVTLIESLEDEEDEPDADAAEPESPEQQDASQGSGTDSPATQSSTGPESQGTSESTGAGSVSAGAAAILADTGFDQTPIFDRSQVAHDATERANTSSFIGGRSSDRICRAADDDAEYARLKASVSGEIRQLQRRIVSEYQTRTRRKSVVSETGRIDGRRLARALAGEHRIYRERVRRPLPYPAVSIVLDCSGSMEGVEIELAKQALVAISEVNASLTVKTELIAFEGGGVEVIKSFDDDLNGRRGAIGSLIAAGGTPTAEALWEAGNRIVARKEERKLILLLTDGHPNDLAGAGQVSRMITASGIELYGIGIACDAVSRFCPGWEVIHRAEDIGRAVLDALRTRILRAA